MKDRVQAALAADIGAKEPLQDWAEIDWRRVKKRVKNLRRRIYRDWRLERSDWKQSRSITVQRDDHAQEMFHLLTLAARLLALGDHTAKLALAQENAGLAGIYPGNPKRSTATPTTERMKEYSDPDAPDAFSSRGGTCGGTGNMAGAVGHLNKLGSVRLNR